MGILIPVFIHFKTVTAHRLANTDMDAELGRIPVALLPGGDLSLMSPLYMCMVGSRSVVMEHAMDTTTILTKTASSVDVVRVFSLPLLTTFPSITSSRLA